YRDQGQAHAFAAGGERRFVRGRGRGRGSEALEEVAHELGKALQVVDESVERRRQRGQLVAEEAPLFLVLIELPLEAAGELLDGGAGGAQFVAGGAHARHRSQRLL